MIAASDSHDTTSSSGASGELKEQKDGPVSERPVGGSVHALPGQQDDPGGPDLPAGGKGRENDKTWGMEEIELRLWEGEGRDGLTLDCISLHFL